MNRFMNQLKAGEILICDGAWGTMLQRSVLKTGQCPEELNLTQPEQVKAVAKAYVDAGSDIILTNTFGGSSLKLAQYELNQRTREINRQGVALSKEVAGDRILVAASVGPTGQFIQPLGEISEGNMFQVFCEQISAQVEGGADIILIETMSDLSEATLAIKAAKEVSTIPVMATMTFEKGARGFRTMMGVSIAQAVDSLTQAGADVIGTNCGNGIEQIIDIIHEMRRTTQKYLIAQPNAGLPRLIDQQTVFDQSPEIMAQQVPALIQSGANIIGGCCGTTPDHIRAMVEQVRRHRTHQIVKEMN